MAARSRQRRQTARSEPVASDRLQRVCAQLGPINVARHDRQPSAVRAGMRWVERNWGASGTCRKRRRILSDLRARAILYTITRP